MLKSAWLLCSEAAEPFTRVISFTAATEDQLKEYPHAHDVEYRGQGGPIKTTVPMTSLQINKMLLEAAQKHGLRLLKDGYGGDVCSNLKSFNGLCLIAWMRRQRVVGLLPPIWTARPSGHAHML